MMEGIRPGERVQREEQNVPNNKKPVQPVQPENTAKAGKDAKKDKTKTGGKMAKRVGSLILAAAVFVGGFGAYHGAKQFGSDRRAKSLVENYTNEDGYCTLPSEVVVNKAYDIVYTSGASFAKYLDKNNVKYCEVLDEYYTPDGSDIAILTFSSATHVMEPAVKVEYDGFVVYMAPEGYTLDGNMCYKESEEEIVKIVPKSTSGDYSGYKLEGLESAELVDVKEVSTQPYSAITDLTLICDVADGTTLNKDNECSATLRLAQRR